MSGNPHEMFVDDFEKEEPCECTEEPEVTTVW